jgi:hypothetical protein
MKRGEGKSLTTGQLEKSGAAAHAQQAGTEKQFVAYRRPI